MAQVHYRGNLSSAGYSFDIRDSGRTVIMPQLDQNFNRQIQSTADSDRDIGIPQVIYLRNAVPTERGFKSLGGFTSVNKPQIVSTTTSLGSYFGEQVNVVVKDDWISTVTPDGHVNKIVQASTPSIRFGEVLFHEIAGSFYSMKVGAEDGNPALYYKTTAGVTTAQQFPLASISGTDKITHLCVVGNRLVFVCNKPSGEQVIAWSSSTSPDDFDFSRGSLTGAGFLTPQHINSPVLKIVPHQLGAIIYTQKDCVAMAFQMGDAINPFTFRPINGVVPGTRFFVSGQYKSPYHFFISEDKCMRISMTGAEPIFSALDSLLRERKFVTVNSSMGITVHEHKRATPTINRVCDRYIVACFVSKAGNAVYCCIYDELLKRWGQAEILAEHLEDDVIGAAIAMPASSDNMFEVRCFTVSTQLVPRIRSIVFDFSASTPAQPSVDSLAIFGKFQQVRGHLICIHAVQFENALSASPTVKIISSLNGKVFEPAIEYYNADTFPLVFRLGESTGVNHAISIEGAFDLNTIELTFTDEGRVVGAGV